MIKKRRLTDEFVSSLPPAKPGKRYEIADTVMPNLIVRVGSKKKVFNYIGRLPGTKNPSRRAIGRFPSWSSDDARATANTWNAQIEHGQDPKQEQEAAEQQTLVHQRRKFSSVMEDHIASLSIRRRNRNARKDAMSLRASFLNPSLTPWLNLPVSEVTDVHVAQVIAAIRDKPAPTQALNVFRLVSSFFKWATTPERRLAYGLETNPILHLKPSQLALSRGKRTHIPNSDHLRAYWKAADETPYPYGPFFKAILLTGGVRRSELSGARWDEFDLKRREWQVPRDRVKNGEELGGHIIPLTTEMIALLDEIRFEQPGAHGPHIFSSTLGQKPINGFSKATNLLRYRMREILREIAPEAVYHHMTIHDNRRIVRTAMAALGVPDVVAEATIGHRRKGIEAVYDQYRYLPQRRAALTLFTERLMQIIDGEAEEFFDEDTGLTAEDKRTQLS